MDRNTYEAKRDAALAKTFLSLLRQEGTAKKLKDLGTKTNDLLDKFRRTMSDLDKVDREIGRLYKPDQHPGELSGADRQRYHEAQEKRHMWSYTRRGVIAALDDLLREISRLG